MGKHHRQGQFDLVVFDGFLPDQLPAKPVLAIAPPRTSPLGSVVGTISGPAIGSLAVDEPLLANVDLSRLHVAQAQQMTLPDWARTVIPSGSDAPLLYSGVRDGLPTAVIAFDLRQSDLPLQVAWPILLSNVAGELLGTGTGTADPIAPATPVELALRPGVDGLRVTLPDASSRELAAAATGAGTLTFVDTHQLGVYRVEDLGADAVALESPVAPGSPAASTASQGSSSPGAAVIEPAVDTRPNSFAVDLFSAQRVEHRAGRRQPAGGAGRDRRCHQRGAGHGAGRLVASPGAHRAGCPDGRVAALRA